MGAPAVGSVVLIPFPVSDLSQSKRRPAVILAAAERGDWVLCQISEAYADARAVRLEATDFESGGLQVTSYARPAKLFTAHESLFVWVRDNGPVFVKDANNRLFVTDWFSTAGGFDTAFRNDNTVPASGATALRLPRIDINEVILENGAVALDGQGVLMATRSSILEPSQSDGA